MFSYRHGFHAGNHADVLKHITLIALLQYLTQKDGPLTLIDTHAGAGLYRLDGDFAQTSGEAQEGVFKLLQTLAQTPAKKEAPSELLQDYCRLLARFNAIDAPSDAVSPADTQGSGGDERTWISALAERLQIYPGSPFVALDVLRPQDRLRLFELHPNEHRFLQQNLAKNADLGPSRTPSHKPSKPPKTMAQAPTQRPRPSTPPTPSVQVQCQDGFAALKALLPPPPSSSGSRRALVFIDPSYELKSDYAQVAQTLADSLQRFATACFVIWYPIIPRPEAHALPRRLKTITQQAGKSWLHLSLNIGQNPAHALASVQERASSLRPIDAPGAKRQNSLQASGIWIVNPPHTLGARLQNSLPELVRLLGRGKGQGFTLESS